FSLPCPAPLASYQRLRRTNPSPYMFYLRSDHRTLFGASPERCVGVDGPSHKVQIRPIAGTAPRGRDGAGRRDPDPDARNEASRRGFYGGAVGYLTHDGTLETCIVIRSALVAGGVAQVRAGAGVVLDSDPVSEARETSRKAQALLEAIAGAGSPAYA